MNEGINPKFVRALALLFMAVCVCGFSTFAIYGFYSTLRSEYFPKTNPWIDLAVETAVICSGCYLGLRLIGVSGLSALAEAFREEPENPFAAMID
jgi:hypothetical protein